MKGSNLAGHSGHRGRVENDYYATPPVATEALLLTEPIAGKIWEPACGGGHISRILKNKRLDVVSSDIINRGYGIGGVDFLKSTMQLGEIMVIPEVDIIITNPPFKFMLEFAKKGLLIARKKVILFGKIQFLEGQNRKEFLKASPLKYVYVFSKRINPWRNGNPTDENGKPWCSTMCFAWYVWEKEYQGETIIKWI